MRAVKQEKGKPFDSDSGISKQGKNKNSRRKKRIKSNQIKSDEEIHSES
jgi:hypothetical protein